MGIEEQKRLPIRPGLPQEAEEALYQQAGIQRPRESHEDHADLAIDLVKSGETWHVSPELNAPAHHAIRTGDKKPLIEAISRARKPQNP